MHDCFCFANAMWFVAIFICLHDITYSILILLRGVSVKPPKIKNITKTVLGETIGRIHMKRQNFDRVAGRKVAALREKRTITEDPDSGSNKGGKRRRIG